MKRCGIFSLLLFLLIVNMSAKDLNSSLPQIVRNVISAELFSSVINVDDMTKAMRILVEYDENDNSRGVYLAKGILYNTINDYDRALLEFRKAKTNALRQNNIPDYLLAVLCSAKSYIMTEQYDAALFQIEMIDNYKEEMTEEQLAYYYDILLCLCSFYLPHNVYNIALEYLNQVNENKVNWGLILKSLISSGDYVNFPISKHSIRSGRFVSETDLILLNHLFGDKLILHNTTCDLYKPISFNLGDYYKIHDIAIEHDYKITTEKKRFLYICSLVVIILFIVICYHYYNCVSERIEDSCKLLEKHEMTFLSIDSIRRIDERLRLLDGYILSLISGNYMNTATHNLAKYLEDSETFLKSTIDTFLIAHPKFIAYLRNLELNEEEIACCCLYALGFKGKTIANYLGWKRGYDRNVMLRDKLNIKGSRINIDTYLARKMSELD